MPHGFGRERTHDQFALIAPPLTFGAEHAIGAELVCSQAQRATACQAFGTITQQFGQQPVVVDHHDRFAEHAKPV